MYKCIKLLTCVHFLAATNDSGGILTKVLRNKGAAKTRTVYSLCTLVGSENIRLEVNDRVGKTINRVSVLLLTSPPCAAARVQ